MTIGFVEKRPRSPGPCAYNTVLTINPIGKYAVSHYKNSLARAFDPACSKRFASMPPRLTFVATLKQRAPGPGTYAPKDGISAQGDYFVSTMKSSKAQHFAKGPRNASLATASRTSTPGPGSYRVPSEFGYYEIGTSTIADRASKTMTAGFGIRSASSYARNNTSYKKKRGDSPSKGLNMNRSLPEFVPDTTPKPK